MFLQDMEVYREHKTVFRLHQANRVLATGGNVRILSGYGSSTSSGVFFSTSNSGTTGVSGKLNLASGTTSIGSSGMILLSTGSSAGSGGGTISVNVGSGNSASGGSLSLFAGLSHAGDGGAVLVKSETDYQVIVTCHHGIFYERDCRFRVC